MNLVYYNNVLCIQFNIGWDDIVSTSETQGLLLSSMLCKFDIFG